MGERVVALGGAAARGKVATNHRRSRLLWRTLAESRPFLRPVGAVILLSLAAVPLVLLSALPLKLAVDSVLGSEPVPHVLRLLLPAGVADSRAQLLLALALMQVVLVLIGEAQRVSASMLSARAAAMLTQRFRSRLLAQAQRLSLSFHDRRGTADSIYRIQHDAAALHSVAVSGVVGLVSSTALILGVFGWLAYLDLSLALIAALVAAPLAAAAYLYNRTMRARYARARALESNALAVVQETLTALRVVKSFGREAHQQERFEASSSTSVRAHLRIALAEAGFGTAVALLVTTATAALLVIGVRRVQTGTLTLGELLMVFAYLWQLFGPLQGIAHQVTGVQNALAGIQRAFELLDEPPGAPERRDARQIVRARGNIVFSGVGFSYDGKRRVLDDISFSVDAGSSLGIFGRTGAGKSTLVNLLARFYDPDEGAILLDGVDVRDYRLQDLRQQFAIVPQEPVLFSGTIAENIAFGDKRATTAQITAAARAASADGFIGSLPDGYDTPVGERGASLSGGERQRVTLARAFLRDAPVLILDEPTSSLDLSTEGDLADVLQRLMAGRTTLVISHRERMLDICDARLGIENGRIRARLAPTPAATAYPATAAS